MKHLPFFIVFVFIFIANLSSCNGRGSNDDNFVPESNIDSEKLSEPVMADLDSLAGLLVDEFKKYDLPHFNPGVTGFFDGVFVISHPSKEESVNYSMGILFCSLGIDITADYLWKRYRYEDILNQKDSVFNHPLPCSFKEYYKRETPTHELFERYYKKCVETGEVEYFWKFQYAFFADAEYLLSYKPSNILDGAPEEQYQSFVRKCRICRSAVEVLSKENPQFASLLEFRHKQAERYKVDDNKSFPSIQDAKKGYPSCYNYYQCIRHNLLTR